MNLDIWKVLLDDPRWADKTDEFAPSKFNPSRSVAVCLYWMLVSWQCQNISVNRSATHGFGLSWWLWQIAQTSTSYEILYWQSAAMTVMVSVD